MTEEEKKEQLEPQEDVGAAAAPPEEIGSSSEDAASEVEGLQARLKEAEERAATCEAQFARLQADFVNFRRRVERERTEALDYGNARLLKDLLPVLDNLQRALAAAEANPEVEALRQGVAQVERQFLGVLAKEGVTPLDPGLGQPFNPELQEVLLREEGEAEVVLKELQPGYRYKEKVLRPTLVQVGPAPAKPEEQEKQAASADGEVKEENV